MNFFKHILHLTLERKSSPKITSPHIFAHNPVQQTCKKIIFVREPEFGFENVWSIHLVKFILFIYLFYLLSDLIQVVMDNACHIYGPLWNQNHTQCIAPIVHRLQCSLLHNVEKCLPVTYCCMCSIVLQGKEYYSY